MEGEAEWPVRAWQVFLHPVKALREILSLREGMEEVRTRCEEEAAAREGMERQERLLLERLSEKDRGLTEYRERVAQLEKELTAARQEVAERKSAEDQIMEFDEWVGRVEALKERYESRIAGMKGRIRQLERRVEEAVPSDLQEIDMRGALPGEGTPGDTDDEWLDPLPVD